MENWKHQVHVDVVGQINAVHERDFATRDKLEMTCEALHGLWEESILLELAVWKASCCRYVREWEQRQHQRRNDEKNDTKAVSPVHSMQDSLMDLDLTDVVKHECRVQSGAEMIIPGVIGFLEDEPVSHLLKDIRLNYPSDHK